MFNMDYVAKQVGANEDDGTLGIGSDIFINETLEPATDILTLTNTAVPIVSGGGNYAWVKKANDSTAELKRCTVSAGNTINLATEGIAGDTKYCVLYRYNNDASKFVKVNAQFIPATLHAVLTVALYYGDACNVESATKAGYVEIDIPRLQLSGAMDLTMCTTCC